MVSNRARVVLDASAVLAVLKLEPGGDAVADVLHQAIISTVNLSEVVTSLVNQGAPFSRAAEVARSLTIEVIPFDEALAFATASLRAATNTRGLSFGDRACVALARHVSLPVMTADTVWAKLDIGVDVRVIR